MAHVDSVAGVCATGLGLPALDIGLPRAEVLPCRCLVPQVIKQVPSCKRWHFLSMPSHSVLLLVGGSVMASQRHEDTWLPLPGWKGACLYPARQPRVGNADEEC